MTTLDELLHACDGLTVVHVERWVARWGSAIAEPAELWTGFLAADPSPYFGVWTEDISAMSDSDDEFAADLRSWLRGLDTESSPGFAAATAQSYLTANPAKITAVDLSHAHVALVRLKLAAVLAVFIGLLGLAQVDRAHDERTFVDGAGRRVTLPDSVSRVVAAPFRRSH